MSIVSAGSRRGSNCPAVLRRRLRGGRCSSSPPSSFSCCRLCLNLVLLRVAPDLSAGSPRRVHRDRGHGADDLVGAAAAGPPAGRLAVRSATKRPAGLRRSRGVQICGGRTNRCCGTVCETASVPSGSLGCGRGDRGGAAGWQAGLRLRDCDRRPGIGPAHIACGRRRHGIIGSGTRRRQPPSGAVRGSSGSCRRMADRLSRMTPSGCPGTLRAASR